MCNTQCITNGGLLCGNKYVIRNILCITSAILSTLSNIVLQHVLHYYYYYYYYPTTNYYYYYYMEENKMLAELEEKAKEFGQKLNKRVDIFLDTLEDEIRQRPELEIIEKFTYYRCTQTEPAYLYIICSEKPSHVKMCEVLDFARWHVRREGTISSGKYEILLATFDPVEFDEQMDMVELEGE